MSKIIDGKAIAQSIKYKLISRLSRLKSYTNRVPKLSVILVGTRNDSVAYVRMKEIAAKEVGINFKLHEFDNNVTQSELLNAITVLNNDDDVHGIIVQLPLPLHINKSIIIESINPHKDVDGFHPLGFGKMGMEGFEPLFYPCTPRGIMKLLEHYNISVEGKHVVVLGQSNIVGMPISLMLLHKNATVTVCNAYTKNEDDITRQADILISACGCPHLVKRDWIKEGAIVIDVGINSIPDSTKKNGYRLVGDVDFENVKERASLITPVPGGVGPMTVAMLMQSTIESFERSIHYKS